MINRETFKAYLKGVGVEFAPLESRKEDLIELYRWVKANASEDEITIFGTHGEANCEIWDEELYREMEKALRTGKVKEKHCLGPIISYNNFNAIVECFKNFPDKIELYITRTRYPYHWTLAKLNNKNTFYFRGQSYHSPLTKAEEKYTLKLEEKEEGFKKEGKIVFEFMQEKFFNSLKERSIPIASLKEIEQYIFSNEEIKEIERIAEEKRYYFDTLNLENIKKIQKGDEI